MNLVNFPHPDKVAKGGEDAFFLLDDAFGVFDGVGSWNRRGIDPALYSRELARLAADFVKRNRQGAICEALHHAVSDNKHLGSCTACVAALHGMDLIGINVGDSGLIVIRGEQVVFETTSQQYRFNAPFQLGPKSKTTVHDGEKFSFRVRAGDLIVNASDG